MRMMGFFYLEKCKLCKRLYIIRRKSHNMLCSQLNIGNYIHPNYTTLENAIERDMTFPQKNAIPSFYPSLFTKSLRTPVFIMLSRGEELQNTLHHPSPTELTNRKKNPIILLLGMMGFLIIFPTFILPLPFFHQ